MTPIFFLTFFFIFLSVAGDTSYPYDVSFSIDCGGAANFTGEFGLPWLSDRFFSGGGSPGLVSEPHRFTQPQEQTLRSFPPPSSGKKNCYTIPVPRHGRYYIRTFTVYDNYDGKLRPPSFDVSVDGSLVFSWRSPWPESVARSGAYSDLFGFVGAGDGAADVCFYSIATDAPVVASIEAVEVDPLSYAAADTGDDLILVNYGRLTCGADLFGPGFTADPDRFRRVWQSDAEYRSSSSGGIKALSSGGRAVAGADRAPNYFPPHLYLTAVTTLSDEDTLEYLLPIDTRLDYMVWFHFAEIDSGVGAAGRRVFDVVVDGENVSRVDIYREVGGFAAFDWYYIAKNPTSSPLSVKLVPVVGRPIISGLENYAMVPLDLSTMSGQVAAMRALKESLRIPDRMGWNGDPCAPSTWDAWEGVTCHHNEHRDGLVVTQLDLGSQGLRGYISDQISLLANLVSLNLSSNSLTGALPSGLAQVSLQKLDLSSNLFSGSIPESLGSSRLQLVKLDNNDLEGQVPENLYSIGVHGGVIDLSGNKGLCGVPTLPPCPSFWAKGNLSLGGKIAIGLTCGVFAALLILLVYFCCVRKGRYDYDFSLPQDLTSIAAKRNRYQRQKSIMLLELETQNPAGFPDTLN